MATKRIERKFKTTRKVVRALLESAAKSDQAAGLDAWVLITAPRHYAVTPITDHPIVERICAWRRRGNKNAGAFDMLRLYARSHALHIRDNTIRLVKIDTLPWNCAAFIDGAISDNSCISTYQFYKFNYEAMAANTWMADLMSTDFGRRLIATIGERVWEIKFSAITGFAEANRMFISPLTVRGNDFGELINYDSDLDTDSEIGYKVDSIRVKDILMGYSARIISERVDRAYIPGQTGSFTIDSCSPLVGFIAGITTNRYEDQHIIDLHLTAIFRRACQDSAEVDPAGFRRLGTVRFGDVKNADLPLTLVQDPSDDLGDISDICLQESYIVNTGANNIVSIAMYRLQDLIDKGVYFSEDMPAVNMPEDTGEDVGFTRIDDILSARSLETTGSNTWTEFKADADATKKLLADVLNLCLEKDSAEDRNFAYDTCALPGEFFSTNADTRLFGYKVITNLDHLHPNYTVRYADIVIVAIFTEGENNCISQAIGGIRMDIRNNGKLAQYESNDFSSMVFAIGTAYSSSVLYDTVMTDCVACDAIVSRTSAIIDTIIRELNSPDDSQVDNTQEAADWNETLCEAIRKDYQDLRLSAISSTISYRCGDMQPHNWADMEGVLVSTITDTGKGADDSDKIADTVVSLIDRTAGLVYPFIIYHGGRAIERENLVEYLDVIRMNLQRAYDYSTRSKYVSLRRVLKLRVPAYDEGMFENLKIQPNYQHVSYYRKDIEGIAKAIVHAE